jgi:acyl-CoA reductase-like NAD-dependent aldehyde dehydrogenase
VNNKALENMEGIVNRTIKSGAELLTGGERMMINNKGYFFRPTIFKDVMSEMEIAQEEIFGPMAPISQLVTKMKLFELQMILNLALVQAYGLRI